MKKIFFALFLVICHLQANSQTDINALTSVQRTKLVNLIMDFACEPQDALDGLSGNEEHSMHAEHSHGADINIEFLPWHHDFIGKLEDFLLENGGAEFVPLPYWDPCSEIPYEFMKAASVCSGFEPPEFATINCGNFGNGTFSCQKICDFESFIEFSGTLEESHNAVHNNIGGSMRYLHASAGTAIFYIWHKYVDMIYQRYNTVNLMGISVKAKLTFDDCCEAQISVPALECLSYSFSMTDAEFLGSTLQNGYIIASFKKLSGGVKTLTVTATSPCGVGQTFTFPITLSSESATPQLSSIPPPGMDLICVGQTECYEFKNIKCLKGLSAKSASQKLLVEVTGNQICFTAIAPVQGTVNVSVTPLGGTCGNGETITWTIKLNDPRSCDEGGFGSDAGGDRNLKQTSNLVKVHPNPASKLLAVESAFGVSNIEIFDAFGKLEISTNSTQIDLSNLPSGMKIIKVSGLEGENQALKFIKQ